MIRIVTKIELIGPWAMPYPSKKFRLNPFTTFSCSYPTDRQTDRSENITSFGGDNKIAVTKAAGMRVGLLSEVILMQGKRRTVSLYVAKYRRPRNYRRWLSANLALTIAPCLAIFPLLIFRTSDPLDQRQNTGPARRALPPPPLAAVACIDQAFQLVKIKIDRRARRSTD